MKYFVFCSLLAMLVSCSTTVRTPLASASVGVPSTTTHVTTAPVATTSTVATTTY